MTTKEVAKEISTSTAWVCELIYAGKLKATKRKGEKSYYWFIEEEDFDSFLLEKSKKGNLPKWYYKLSRRISEPLESESQTAHPWQVCIKNVLPTVTKEQYIEICKRSEERSK